MSGRRTVPRNRVDYVVNDHVVHCIGPRTGAEEGVGVYASGGRVWQVSFAPILPPLQIAIADLFNGPITFGGTICSDACRDGSTPGANKRKTGAAAGRVSRNGRGRRPKADSTAAADGDVDESEEWI